MQYRPYYQAMMKYDKITLHDKITCILHIKTIVEHIKTVWKTEKRLSRFEFSIQV